MHIILSLEAWWKQLKANQSVLERSLTNLIPALDLGSTAPGYLAETKV